MLDPTNSEINAKALADVIRSEVRLRREKIDNATQVFEKNANVADLDIEAIVEKIRFDTRLRKIQIEKNRFSGESIVLPRFCATEDKFEKKREYRIADFVKFEDDEFIRNAFRGLLCREADDQGLGFYLNLLRNGTLSKLDILSMIRSSREAILQNVKIEGINPATVDGFSGSLGLDESDAENSNIKTFELGDLLNHHDNDFIVAAYRIVLGRKPDSGGRTYYLSALRSGTLSKLEIIGRLRYSREGRLRKISINGLWLKFLIKSLYRLPFLGYVIALATTFVRLPLLIKNLQRLETYVDRRLCEQFEGHDRLMKQCGSIDRNLANLHRRSSIALNSCAEISEQVEIALNRIKQYDIGQSEAVLAELAQNRVEVAELRKLVQPSGNEEDRGDLGWQIREALAEKADCIQLDSLAEQLRAQVSAIIQSEIGGTRFLGIESRLDTIEKCKASIEQFESFAAMTKEEILLTRKTVEAKAANEELTRLANHLVELIGGKADNSKVIEFAEQTQQQLMRKCDVEQLHEELGEIDRRILDHKRNILEQQRRLALLLEEARKRMPAPINQDAIERMLTEEDHLLDAFYYAFEDYFRGTREEIKSRMLVYLPFIENISAGTMEAPVLDIGCGRGELLEVLREHKLVGRGIDMNRVMITQCRELGLDVIEADAVQHLRELMPNSQGAVTATHVIEHLPFRRLVVLIDEVLRILKPGGVAIFETPNPENLIVGACNFYFDPTHIHPLPPESMRFVMEARGFIRVEIVRLRPQPDFIVAQQGVEPQMEKLNKLLSGAQDYLLVAYKA